MTVCKSAISKSLYKKTNAYRQIDMIYWYLVTEVNILLIGGGDCRHVLQTLARAHRHPHTHLNVCYRSLLFFYNCSFL